ncbi:hypothetical protein EDB84DRAFT_1604500, partial [Lactarius hengduanensis]
MGNSGLTRTCTRVKPVPVLTGMGTGMGTDGSDGFAGWHRGDVVVAVAAVVAIVVAGVAVVAAVVTVVAPIVVAIVAAIVVVKSRSRSLSRSAASPSLLPQVSCWGAAAVALVWCRQLVDRSAGAGDVVVVVVFRKTVSGSAYSTKGDALIENKTIKNKTILSERNGTVSDRAQLTSFSKLTMAPSFSKDALGDNESSCDRLVTFFFDAQEHVFEAFRVEPAIGRTRNLQAFLDSTLHARQSKEVYPTMAEPTEGSTETAARSAIKIEDGRTECLRSFYVLRALKLVFGTKVEVHWCVAEDRFAQRCDTTESKGRIEVMGGGASGYLDNQTARTIVLNTNGPAFPPPGACGPSPFRSRQRASPAQWERLHASAKSVSSGTVIVLAEQVGTYEASTSLFFAELEVGQLRIVLDLLFLPTMDRCR